MQLKLVFIFTKIDNDNKQYKFISLFLGKDLKQDDFRSISVIFPFKRYL